MDIDQLCINTIRTLSMDAVQAAVSGHPGTPMAMAPVAYTIWQRYLRYDPESPLWPDRDRFVLSAGHASMLLYSLLHLTGVRAMDAEGKVTREPAVSLDEIRRFRQLGSRCPGHPEYGLTTGVECTTGPLGQGAGMSVGMAIAGRWLAARYNRPGAPLFDHDIYALCSDGDMMEGVSSEAASIAGYLGLSNLCWLYDANQITIEGSTALTFGDDVGARFLAYGWDVLRVRDANDLQALDDALRRFRETRDRPTLILVQSRIAWGAPTKEGTAEAHGEALGEEEVKGAKRFYGWPEDAKFLVPPEVPEHFRQGMATRGAGARAAWESRFEEYRRVYPEQAAELGRMWRGELPEGWERDLPSFPADPKGTATRVSSGKVLNALAARIPWLLGGAADLAPSTRTLIEKQDSFARGEYGGRNFHFGVREHSMAAILNGMALSGLRPYGATFFIFSDYLKPSLRLAALMELPVIYIFTHDSIFLGEDGPTHQPIEQLAHLRALPGLTLIRPADANEVVEAWKVILRLERRPAALVLTRQNLPTFDRSRYASAAGVARGAYVLADAAAPRLVFLASGSEVALCIEAHEALGQEGIPTRVVSMPSWDRFEEQDQAYRDSVIPPGVPARVAVEAGSTFGWERYVGPRGEVIGMHGFGASAPYKDLQKHFGFTVEAVIGAARRQLARAQD